MYLSKIFQVVNRSEEFSVSSINEIYEHYIIFVRDLNKNETVDKYVTDLRRIAVKPRKSSVYFQS